MSGEIKILQFAEGVEVVPSQFTGTTNAISGLTAITSGQSSLVVTFTTPFLNANYILVAFIENADASNILLSIEKTVKTTDDVTFTFNTKADSANYKVNWVAYPV